MTKNTKAKVTLLLAINKRHYQLDAALDAIARQTDKNFNIIFLFNGVGNSEKDIFKKYDFKSINKVDYVFASENMGESYSFRYAFDFTETEYFYSFDSNTILHPDFVATINQFIEQHPDADIITFFGVPNIYFKEPYIKVKTLSDDFCHRPLVSFDNKVIRLKYLIDNNISTPIFTYWPLYFYANCIKGNPSWYSIGRRLCDSTRKPLYQYNVMDLYDQCEALVDLLDKKPFSDHYEEIEYLCMVSLFRNFTYGFFQENRGRIFPQRRILNKIEMFMDKNFPHWQKNKFLDPKINKNDKTYIEYLKDFKPKYLHVIRTIFSKDFLKGYGSKK